jgi:hypothetical protein
MEQNRSLSLLAWFDALALVSIVSGDHPYEHDEIHLLADEMYEGERQDCYKQGTWPTVQSHSFRRGTSLAK